jgi:hypothetical protein
MSCQATVYNRQAVFYGVTAVLINFGLLLWKAIAISTAQVLLTLRKLSATVESSNGWLSARIVQDPFSFLQEDNSTSGSSYLVVGGDWTPVLISNCDADTKTCTHFDHRA